MSSQTPRTRFWFEVSLAVFTGFLTLLTAVWPDWIETIFRTDPDHGSGALEWAIVAVLAVATVASGILARIEWVRHAQPA